MARPQPIIIPSGAGAIGGLGGTRTASRQDTQIDLGGIIDLIKDLRAPNEEDTRAREAEALVNLLKAKRPDEFGDATRTETVKTPEDILAGRSMDELVNIPSEDTITHVTPSPRAEALRQTGQASTEGLTFLRKIAGEKPVAAKKPKIFGLVDPGKHKKASVKAFQKTVDDGQPDYSLLELDTQVINRSTKGKTPFDKETLFRKEFLKLSQVFVSVRDSIQRIENAATEPSAAGDLAMIFNYMKILDPGSVVRESEFATARNAGGVDDRTRALWNRLLEGEQLAPEQRADFLNRARKLFSGTQKLQDHNIAEFTRLAKDNKLRVGNIIVDLNVPVEEEIPQAPEGFTFAGEDDTGGQLFKNADGLTIRRKQ